MPEISARDLRRLRSAEEREGKLRTERDELRGERRELRERLRAAEGEARSAGRDVDRLERQLSELLEENRRLATQVEDLSGDLRRVEEAAENARAQVDPLRAQVSEEQERRRAAESRLKAGIGERDRLATRVQALEAQLEGEPMVPILPPQEAAALLDGFVERLGLGVPGLVLRDGEFKLRFAFAKVGEVGGFVLPTADSPPELKEALHGVSLRLEHGLRPEVEREVQRKAGEGEPGAWHSVKSAVYHDNPQCRTGNNIESENRREGTGGKRRCAECARLSG